MKQLAIQFNNKGVEFHQNRCYVAALYMFITSLEPALRNTLHQIQYHPAVPNITTTGQSAISSGRHCYTEIAIKMLNAQPAAVGPVVTKDKINDQVNIFSKTISLRALTTGKSPSFADDSNHNSTLIIATILFNTAVTYHLWIDDFSSDNPLGSNVQKAIGLYSLVLEFLYSDDGSISHVPFNERYVYMVKMASIMNMMHLHNEQGRVDLVSLYRIPLSQLALRFPLIKADEEANNEGPRTNTIIRNEDLCSTLDEIVSLATLYLFSETQEQSCTGAAVA